MADGGGKPLTLGMLLNSSRQLRRRPEETDAQFLARLTHITVVDRGLTALVGALFALFWCCFFLM